MTNEDGFNRRDFIRLSAAAALAMTPLIQRAELAHAEASSSVRGDLLFAATERADLVLFRRSSGIRRRMTSRGVDSYHPAPIPGSSHTAYIELTPTVGRLLLVGDNGSAREPAAPQLRDLNVRYPTASPSGEAVAVSVAFDLLVLEPFHDPPTVHRLTDGDSHDTEPTWAPDERAIAFTRLTPPDPHTGSHSSDIFMIDLTSGDVTQLTASGNAASPRWSPSGEWIAWDDQTTVGLVASTGVASSQNGDGGLGSAWSPDGTSLVYGRGDSLIVWDVPTGGESPVAEGLPGEVHSPDWDESGDRIAFLVGRTGAGSAAYELDRPSGTVRKVSAAVSRDAVYTRA